jgi:hypothetical protein
MLNAIKAVIRCTATNDTIPVLTHVAIQDGLMHAFNGRMYARMAIESNPFELNGICVRADMLQAALTALGETKTKVEIDEEHGTLRFNSKRYRARVPVRPIADFYMQDEFKRSKAAKLNDFDLGAALATIRGVVGDNPAIPWANGFLLATNHIASTNTSIMAQMVAPCGIADTIITAEFASEIIAQGQKVTHLLSSNGRVTAWFENGLVLSSVIIDGAWPKSFDTVVGPLHKGAKFTPVPEGFAEALQMIVPFSTDGAKANITINGDKIELVSSETASASVTVDGLATSGQCAFNVEQLRLVLSMAADWDLGKFPMVPFRDKKRGIIGGFAGVRV